MAKENTIILCAGPINFLDLPVTTNLSMSMIPVNGKPVIGWIMDDLIDKGITSATVVMKSNDLGLARFLNSVYADRLEVHLQKLDSSDSINTSLQAGLETIPDATLVRVILGDTLIRDPFKGSESFAYTAEVESSSRWCVVNTNGNKEIIEYIDKPDADLRSPSVLTGYYHFTDAMWLRSCVAAVLHAKERELSRVLVRYGTRHPIRSCVVKDWFDFGHTDTLVHSRNRLLQARYFNSLKVDPLYHTVTKLSQNNEKLEDELNWYLSLPEELKVLSPRIVRSSRSASGEISITQEYYGYPTLAELYVYSDLKSDTWTSVLKLLFKLHKEFRKYPGESDKVGVESMYAAKTKQRLADLAADPYWKSLMDRREIVVNGKSLKNLPQLAGFIKSETDKLVSNAVMTIIHGDYCFSNILFDINNQIIRLIDPRGAFGKKGIYGDPRYDIAKLRHSIREQYDYIIADMFKVTTDNQGAFDITIYATDVTSRAAEIFDRLLTENGYSIQEIKFIEALLFLSMIPLHHGKLRRQQVMYCWGIKLLNEIAP